MQDLIYAAIRDRLEQSTAIAHLTTNGFSAITKIVIYNRQYEEEREHHPMPNRPVLFVEFQPFELVSNAGFLVGPVPVVLHLAQDCYKDGDSKSASEDEYLALLQYKNYLVDLLEGLKITCGTLSLVRIEPDHQYKNLLVEKLHFKVKVKYKPTVVAPPAP